MANPSDPVLTALVRQGFRFKKELGQNFLFHPFILEQIAECAGIRSGDVVIEAGAGAGSLTAALAATGASVIAVELDRALIPVLRQRFAQNPGVTILQGDILKMDLDSLAEGGTYKLCANLPYHISTAFLSGIFRHTEGLAAGAVLLQKEVANKVTALPGSNNYGLLALAAAWFGDTKQVMRLGPEYFTPPPPVDSAVVAFQRKPNKPDVAEEILWRVIRGLFNQRRKNLVNGLKSLKPLAPRGGEGWAEVLEKAGLDYQRRPETLSLEEFALIARAVDY